MLINGIDLTPYFRIKDIRGRGIVSRIVDATTVPGMNGEHPRYVETPTRFLELDIRILAVGGSLRKTIDKLNEILTTDKPAEFVFPDEPEMTYYGTVESVDEDGEKVHLGRHDTTIYIRRSDVLKYGKEAEVELTSEVGKTFRNNGTAESKPVVEFEVLGGVTYAMLQNHLGDYMILGKPLDVENEQPFEKYEEIFRDEGNSRVPWSNAVSSDIDGGVVIGNIITRNGRFVAESYGTGTAWHGPAIKRGLTSAVQDFRLEVNIDLWNSTASQVGRLEVYIKDVLGRDVGKLALKDTSNGKSNIQVEFRAGGLDGGKYILSESNSKWNNFQGKLVIMREGNKWYCYIAQVSNGRVIEDTMKQLYWTDEENKYMSPATQLVVHAGAVGTFPPFSSNSGINSIIVHEIHQEPDGVPYIASAGDRIIFDFVNRKLLLNGEDRKDLKTDLGGSYFKIKPGENTLAISPSNNLKGTLKYRPAFK